MGLWNWNISSCQRCVSAEMLTVVILGHRPTPMGKLLLQLVQSARVGGKQMGLHTDREGTHTAYSVPGCKSGACRFLPQHYPLLSTPREGGSGNIPCCRWDICGSECLVLLSPMFCRCTQSVRVWACEHVCVILAEKNPSLLEKSEWWSKTFGLGHLTLEGQIMDLTDHTAAKY